MNTPKRQPIAITLALMLSTLCYSRDIASDFEQVLGTLREKAIQARRSLYYYDVNDAVNDLVAEHSGASPVSFLEGKIKRQEEEEE